MICQRVKQGYSYILLQLSSGKYSWSTRVDHRRWAGSSALYACVRIVGMDTEQLEDPFYYQTKQENKNSRARCGTVSLAARSSRVSYVHSWMVTQNYRIFLDHDLVKDNLLLPKLS